MSGSMSAFGYKAAVAVVLFIAVVGTAAHAETACGGRSDALGTARVLAVNAAATPRVGRKSFPGTLPLAPKEVVLTFDDGPWPSTTPRVLDALKDQCVRATFFLLGRNAVAKQALARREVAEGHTIGYHTYSHPLLGRMPFAAAVAEIERGIAAVNGAAFGKTSAEPVAPFFRFPGFVSSPALLDELQRRRIVVFGADVWASDWLPMSPQQELQLLMRRIEQVRGGIVLLHDTKAATAAMLPGLLRALKAEGYSAVHVVPAGGASAPPGP